MIAFALTSLIGDPTPWGWTITFAYFAAAALCFRAARRASEARPRWWLSLAVLELLLGINKQLDLHRYIPVVGRAIVKREGEMAHARQFQAVFIAILLCMAAVALIATLKSIWPPRGRYAVAFAGVCITAAFVLLRAATFNHVADHSRWIDPIAEILEPVGIAVISVAALSSRFG